MATRRGVLARDPVTELRLVGGILAVAIAGIHLFHPRFGSLRLVQYLQLGTIYDPLPVLFTLTSFLIVLGILLVHRGLLIRPVYLLGILLMVGLILGYAAWHSLLDHGAFWPHIATHGHEGLGPIELLIGHAVDDPLGMLSKVLEFMLAGVLVALSQLDGEARR